MDSKIKKSKLKIDKVRDETESYRINKGILWDLPFSVLSVGKSYISGKSNLYVNTALKDEFNRNDFHGENMFVMSNSSKEPKTQLLISEKEIPKTNVFSKFNEDILEEIYNFIEERYYEALEEKQKPPHFLIYLDDCSFGGNLKSNHYGTIPKIFQNGRHINCSIWINAQKYSDILCSCRENSTCLFLFSCSDKQLDLITEDHNFTNKKLFKKKFRQTTNEKHSFMCVNYSNDFKDRYLDSNFNIIDMSE